MEGIWTGSPKALDMDHGRGKRPRIHWEWVWAGLVKEKGLPDRARGATGIGHAARRRCSYKYKIRSLFGILSGISLRSCG